MNDELYMCVDCRNVTVGYNNLWHPDEYVGGHCPSCGGSDLKEITEEEEEQ